MSLTLLRMHRIHAQQNVDLKQLETTRARAVRLKERHATLRATMDRVIDELDATATANLTPHEMNALLLQIDHTLFIMEGKAEEVP
jgi:hypothetical protein